MLAPRWKEDDWRLTRKLLKLLLEPSQDILRRALWPRVGETTVGGSKIEYQTEMAKLTLAGWAEEDHVRQDARWYGNRVKDWMHKYVVGVPRAREGKLTTHADFPRSTQSARRR